MQYHPEPESGTFTSSTPAPAEPARPVEPWREREFGGAPPWLLAVAVVAVVVVPALAYYLSAA